MKTITENKRLAAEIQRLKEENSALRKKERSAIRYIRDKVDQLLVIMGTVPLKPEELEDDTLIDLDPIGIVSDSFAQVLDNVRTTNESLQMANDEIEAIIDSVQAGILVMDSECKILSYNQKMADLFKEGAENIMGRSCNEVLCGKDEPDEHCVITRILAGEKNAVKKGWSCRGKFYDVTATPITDSSGKLSRIVMLYADVTQRKKAEEEIKESEERYRDLFENASDLIQIVKPDGHIDYVNRSWREILGYNNYEITKLTVFDLIHPECISHCLDLFKKVIQGEQVEKFETKFIAKDGREILLEGTTSCKFEDGRLSGFSDVVLLADDDLMVTAVGSAMLKRLGFEVLTAVDGQEAVDLYTTNRETVCLVILDVSMPKKDGIAALCELKEINNEVKVILASGYAEDQVIKGNQKEQPNGFLHKPFKLWELSDTINKVLSGREGGS